MKFQPNVEALAQRAFGVYDREHYRMTEYSHAVEASHYDLQQLHLGRPTKLLRVQAVRPQRVPHRGGCVGAGGGGGGRSAQAAACKNTTKRRSLGFRRI